MKLSRLNSKLPTTNKDGSEVQSLHDFMKETSKSYPLPNHENKVKSNNVSKYVMYVGFGILLVLIIGTLVYFLTQRR